MPTPQKEHIVQEMTEKFRKATGVYLVDFSGMDVNTTTALRKTLREKNVEYRVLKNTLAMLSFHQAGIKDLDEFLTGVNAYAISYDDPSAPIKLLEEQKQFKEKLKYKAAYFDGTVVGPDKVETLAKLPSRAELIGQFVSMINSPLVKLVGTLNGALASLVNVLKSLEEKKNK